MMHDPDSAAYKTDKRRPNQTDECGCCGQLAWWDIGTFIILFIMLILLAVIMGIALPSVVKLSNQIDAVTKYNFPARIDTILQRAESDILPALEKKARELESIPLEGLKRFLSGPLFKSPDTKDEKK